MAAKSELKGRISLDNRDFLDKLRTSVEASKKFSFEVAKGMLEASGAMYIVDHAAQGVANIFERLKGALDLGKDAEKLGARLRVTAGTMTYLQAVFEKSDVDIGEVGQCFNYMERSISGVNMEGKNVINTFSDIGLSIDDLRAMRPEEQFQVIGEAIMRLKNPIDQVTAAMDIFGRGGGEMIQVFANEGVFGRAQQALGGQIALLDRYSNMFAEVIFKSEDAERKIQGFFVGMMAPIAQVAMPFLDMIERLDFSATGFRFGTSIAQGIRVLYHATELGQLSEVLYLTGKVGFQRALNWLIEEMPMLQRAFMDIFNSDMKSRISDLFDAVALHFGAALLDSLAKPITAVQGAIEYQNDRAQAFQDAQRMELEKNQAAFAAQRALHHAQQDQTALQEAIMRKESPSLIDFLAKEFNKDKSEYRKQIGIQNIDEREEKRFQKISDESYSDYMTDYVKNNSPTFFGATSSDMRNQGDDMIKRSTEGMQASMLDLFATIKADLNPIGPPAPGMGMGANSPLGDDTKQLKALLDKLSSPIPGEGKTEEPDYKNPGLDDLVNPKPGRQYRLERMHAGLDGAFNSVAGRHFGRGALNGGFADALGNDLSAAGGRHVRHFGMSIATPGGLGGGIGGPSIATAHAKPHTEHLNEAQKQTRALERTAKATEDTAKSVKLAIAG